MTKKVQKSGENVIESISRKVDLMFVNPIQVMEWKNLFIFLNRRFHFRINNIRKRTEEIEENERKKLLQIRVCHTSLG